MSETLKRSRVRSPAYPTIDLRQAIEKIERLYESEHRTAAPMEAIASAWGYSRASSALASAIAACKQYGLLDESGRGDDRLIEVSDRGFDLVVEPRDSPRWIEAVTAAAAGPSIFVELSTQFGGHGSDANVRAFLLRKGFNAKATKPCIRNYRRTTEFANSVGSGQSDVVESGLSSDTEVHRIMVQNTALQGPSAGFMPTNKDVLPLTVVMADGSNRVVYIPKMTEDMFDQFKSLLDMYRNGIVIREAAAMADPQNDGSGED